ncbi:hypothetical protein DPMN_158715 [Dreissena polymorpha]|uniref:NACHT domain-containing protein n=1 Tax=Dreissena polymorpha TaxID=45954 RepID=A0A9D4ING4_DREPO|nr:hypothetical protein DPMN_158715 [Dreissena polymorpha]
MASIAKIFDDQEKTNWLKAWLALDITKIGLQDFIKREIKNFQSSILQSVASNVGLSTYSICRSCLTANLLKCPSKGICNKSQINPVCKLHDTPTKQRRPCPNRICDAVCKEIIQAHRYNGPSWNNTSAEQWAINHWEVAKCYMPPDGYIRVCCIEDTDFNGVVSVVLNCKYFDNSFSFSLAPHQQKASCLLTKARDISKAVRHSSDLKVTNTDLQDYFRTLVNLLSDSRVLLHDSGAQDAVRKLNQLENDPLYISELDTCQLLKDILRKHEQASEETKTQLQTEVRDLQQKVTVVEHAFEETKTKFQTNSEHIEILYSRQDVHEKAVEQRLIDSLQNREEKNYDQSVQDFREQLIKHYQKKYWKVAVSPLMPKNFRSLKETYVAPKIRRIVTENDGSRKKQQGQVSTYEAILHTYQDSKERIFLQGEPGKGKSTFAAKLVLDWCNECTSVPARFEEKKYFVDVKTLSKYKFVFFVELRESKKETKITELIKEQIIKEIYDETDKVNAHYFLLQRIMERETSLVIEDGLDEWSTPDNECAMPCVASSFQCLVLVTTRPWKISDERLMISQFDSLLEIEGVNDPFILSKRILECVVHENIDTANQDFQKYIAVNRLNDLLMTPVLLTITVCLWVDKIHLKGSICEIYSNLLDSMLKKVNNTEEYFHQPPFQCFKDLKHLKPNMDQIERISEAAFCLLFLEKRERSLVFTNKKLSKYLSAEQVKFALKVGILSEREYSTMSNKPLTCSFLHKSLQEFLAAIHIAEHVETIYDRLNEYLKSNNKACFEIDRVFTFLCGLNIAAANKLSQAMDRNLTAPSNLVDATMYQNMIISGYWEAKANKVVEQNICLQLSHFDLCLPRPGLKRILSTNKSNVKYLVIDSTQLSEYIFRETLVTSTQSLTQLIVESIHPLEKSHSVMSSFILDLSSHYKLEVLSINGPITLKTNSLRQLENLTKLTLTGCKCAVDLSSCRKLTMLHLDEHVTVLPNALRHLENLKQLLLGFGTDGVTYFFRNSNKNMMPLSPDALCDLHNLEDISIDYKCNGLELNECGRLKEVCVGKSVTLSPFVQCNFKDVVSISIYCKVDALDLSSFRMLQGIFLCEEVTVVPNSMQNLCNLQCLHLECKYANLDLSIFNHLRNIFLCEQVSLLPNTLRHLQNIEHLTLKCRYDNLDVSTCIHLRTLSLCGGVSLTPNTFQSFHGLERLELDCAYDGLRWIGFGENWTKLRRALRYDYGHKNILFKLLDVGMDCIAGLKELSLGKNVILLPNALQEINGVIELTLLCKYDGLDLSSCHRLRILILDCEVTLVPNSLNYISELNQLHLMCQYGGLHLSSCQSLSKLVLCNSVTLVPHSLRCLRELEHLELFCKYDDLDLSLCHRLKTLILDKHVTVLQNTLDGLNELNELHLVCQYDGLDLSSCQSLSKLVLVNSVTLVPHSLRGLRELKHLELYCKYEGLDLSTCRTLRNLRLGSSVTVLPKTLDGLNELNDLQLYCQYGGLHLSSCQSLSKLVLGNSVRLVPHSLRGLRELEQLKLFCKYDDLDLSLCHRLKTLILDKHVTVLQNTLDGLNELNELHLVCQYDGLDFSSCQSLSKLVLCNSVTLVPHSLRCLRELKHLELYCKYEGLDLSTCRTLRNLRLGSTVTLVPNALRDLRSLESLVLCCKYDDLDVSLCHRLRTLILDKHVTVLQNTLDGLNELNDLQLYCQYDGLDLSSNQSLRKLVLCNSVTLVPHSLRDLRELEQLKLVCKYADLDLSLFQRLKTLILFEHITVLPKTLDGLNELNDLGLVCQYDGLDLSSCQSLSKLVLCNSVTLVPHSLRGPREIEHLELLCKYDGLDLSSCKMLRILKLCNTVSLVPNTLHNLQTLEYLELSCAYENLDLSECRRLTTLILNKHITLLPKTMDGLRELNQLHLICQYDGLDVSSCKSLRKLVLCNSVTLVPHSLRDLRGLEHLELLCKYDELDLSLCQTLRTLILIEHVTVLPKTLDGLNELNDLQLYCQYDRLDLSSCQSLRKLVLYNSVTLVPHSLLGLRELEHLELFCKYDGLDLSMYDRLKTRILGEQITLLSYPLADLN